MNKTFNRLRALKAYEWPAPPPNPEDAPGPLQEKRQIELWAKVARVEGALDALGGPGGENGFLAEHVLLVAYRISRGLALAGNLAARGGYALGNMTPRAWETSIVGVRGAPTDEATLDPRSSPQATVAFADLLRTVAGALKVRYGGPDHMIVQWFLEDPITRVSIAWPSPSDLILFEGDLLERTRSRLEQGGRMPALRYLMETLGMARGEAQDLLVGAMTEYKVIGQVDPDIERGILLARVEKLYRKASKANQLREEGNALKLHAQIAGLTRELPQVQDEDDVDLVGTIERVYERDGPPVKPTPPAIEIDADHDPPKDAP
jgi:hypothetical protein